MHSIVFSLFAGKSYAIFALLFGLTFYIQQSNQRKRGKDFGYRFLWRLLLLVVFSFINSMVYPGGDVLMLFAFMALLLFITRNWSTKWVFALAILFLLHPYEWIQQLLGNSLHPQLNVALYGEVALAATEGSHLDFILSNLWTGQKASLMWAFENGRLFQTGGLFLLGMLAGRISIFEETDKNRRIWRNLLMISAVLFAPFFTLSQMYAGSYAGVALDMWQKLLFTALLLSTFIQLYWSVDGFKRICSPLL